ncbi:MAG: alpha/beta hydrolase [Actinomycetota bacterium]|nr:alpha/beta hydrolase [Actinomycetota bacterium]
MKKQGVVALAGAAAGVAAGLATQRAFVARRRRNDPEAGERFGTRRGVRPRTISLSDGADAFVEEAGPPSSRGAVFVHGSALRTDLWHYQLPGLDDRRLVFYDLRGHGVSREKGSARFSINQLANDLVEVIDECGLEEVVIVGHSIGGMVALDLAATRQDLLGARVQGLVLVNTTYRPAVETVAGGAALAHVERLLRRPLDLVGRRAPTIDKLRAVVKPSDLLFLTVAYGGFGPGAPASQVDFVYDMLSETPADVIFDLISSYRDFDVTEVLGDVTVPCLVIGGSNDRITVPAASEYLAEHLPKAELKMFDRCGHMPMLERHREFNASVTSFLDDTLGGSRSRT